MYSKIPFTKKQLDTITSVYPTPFHIYDESRIREKAQLIKSTMQGASIKGFMNYFAVKALPNPSILSVLKEEGMGVDCSSRAELELARQVGFAGDQIMYTSNNTSIDDFRVAHELDAIINFDDVSLVEPFIAEFGAPRIACCRYNPGDINFDGVEEQIIGSPSQAKYGMPKDQIIQAYRLLSQAGTQQFGLHTMLLSNALMSDDHLKIADAMFELATDLSRELGVKFDFINLGGGIGVPYRPDQPEFDLHKYAVGLHALLKKRDLLDENAPDIVMENGRWVTADSGYLVTRAINRKSTHKQYVGVDASMADLMRPGMYDAYHHITVLDKNAAPPTEIVDVVGSLCENNDKFAIDRSLPKINKGGYVVIHTTGAHGHAMGFQYNGMLRSAELLLHADKTVSQIRRAETLDDYFATLKF